MDDKKRVITVTGPTAAGKSALAMALFDALPSRIISVDSALVYRGLNIGAAKPSDEELQRYPHALVNIRDPSRPYTVADFCRDAKVEIEKAHQDGVTPILVGGTMLYFRALLEGLSNMPPSDAEVRAKIEGEAEKSGWPAVHEWLAQVDPECASKIHPNHSQRIARALEVYLISGSPMSSFRQKRYGALIDVYDWRQIAVTPEDRALIHTRIESRFDTMLAQGLESEVRKLFTREDLNDSLPAIRAVGYRQMWQYLQGDFDIGEARLRAIYATRQLAKRQFTWLRKWQGLHWLYTATKHGGNLTSTEIVNNALNFLAKRTI